VGLVSDQIVRRKGAYLRQMRALRNLQEVGIPFRFNSVLSKLALPQAVQIAKLGIATGVQAINYLTFNPFNDQRTGKRSQENVPTYSEVAHYITPALDLLMDAGIEVNVRYLPLCILSERHRQTLYNFRQIPYDLHENDFASWSWTDLPDQRIGSRPLSPPLALGPRLKLGPLREPARAIAAKFPEVGTMLHTVKQTLEFSWAETSENAKQDREKLYQQEAYNRAQEYCGYDYGKACQHCDVRAICDGFHGDYIKIFGMDEAKPIKLGAPIENPTHFISNQTKRVHPDDLPWLQTATV
jgi:hypothetical protein